MIAIDPFVSTFSERAAAKEPGWLGTRRKAAMDRFSEAGIPTTRLEDWRFTNLTPLSRIGLGPAPALGDAAALSGVLGCWQLEGCDLLVLVNGRFSPALSRPGQLPGGARVAPLASCWGDATLEQHLGRVAGVASAKDGSETDPASAALVALNTALVEDGLLIELPAGVALERPLQIVHLQAPQSEGGSIQARTLIVAGPGARATVIETFVGGAESAYFCNAVTEVVLGENAQLDHVKLQNESPAAVHVAAIQAIQARSSVFRSHSISLGARLARNDINSLLGDEGCECAMNGLFIAGGEQHVDHHTAVDHAKPHCNSFELYKGILAERARGVFNGKIFVRPQAQRTNAIQNNKNLLLSDDATINTKPQLEIWADDVRCTHGATIGQLDEDQLFYLRSRGIDRAAAQRVLVNAFAGDVVARLANEQLRGQVEALVRAQLERLVADRAAR